MFVVQEDQKTARNHLLSALHSSPLDTTLHENLLTLSLRSVPGIRDSVLRMCQSVTAMNALLTVAHLACGQLQSALSYAQKAVSTDPGKVLHISHSTCTVANLLICVLRCTVSIYFLDS